MKKYVDGKLVEMSEADAEKVEQERSDASKPAPYAPSNLTPRRFSYLLAITGLDDVWAVLEAELKTTDRAKFAQIKAQRSAHSFSQAKTLGLVAMFADTAKVVAPDADLSIKAIKAAWKLAEQVEL